MSEMIKFEGYKKRLQGVCDENDLVFRFRNDTYPITLTIRPTGGIDAQMSLLESVEEKGYMSPDAYIRFAYVDGKLKIETSETFTIEDTLYNKIKNLYKNMHFLWLQFFNREIVEKGVLKDLPRIEQEEIYDEDDADAEDDAASDLITTVDGSGLVTHVQFPGEDSDEGDDAGMPGDDIAGETDDDLPGDDDSEDDYNYDDPYAPDDENPEDDEPDENE